jgi:hypothetical protein
MRGPLPGANHTELGLKVQIASPRVLFFAYILKTKHQAYFER